MSSARSAARRARPVDAGFTLIAVLVLVGIVGVMAGVFLKRVQHARDRVDSLRLQGEMSQLRRHLNARIDCESIPKSEDDCSLRGRDHNTCATRRIELKAHNGTTLVDASAAGTEIAPGLRLRACCDEGNLRVEAKRTTAVGTLKKDPFTETASYNWRDVYESESSPCDYYRKDGTTLLTPAGVTVVKDNAYPLGVVISLIFETAFNCPAYTGAAPEIYIEAGGTATCPVGYKAVSGGAACESMTWLPWYESGSHWHPGGFQKLSAPSSDGRSWVSSCCLAHLALPVPIWPQKVTALCVRQ